MNRWAIIAGFFLLLAVVGFTGWIIAAVDTEEDDEEEALIDAQRAVVVPTSERTRKLVVPGCPTIDAEVDDAGPSSGPQEPNTLVLPPDTATRTVILPSCIADPDATEVDETPGGREDAEPDTRAGILVLPPDATVPGIDEAGEAPERGLRPESVLIVPGDSRATVVRVPRCREGAVSEEHVTLSDPDGDGVIQAPACG